MKVLSLFSGVGGFDMGLENAGMETVFQCEWDKHANSILYNQIGRASCRERVLHTV